MSTKQHKLLLLQRQNQRQQQITAIPPPPYTARPLIQSNIGMSHPNTNPSSLNQPPGPSSVHSRLRNSGILPTTFSPVFPVFHPPNMASTIATPAADEDEDGDEDESPICGNHDTSSITISINAPVHIEGNNNHLTFDPGSAASMIGNSLIQSLRTAGVSGVGIPMIDENGRPRPIHVNVMAGTEVRGSGNAIGTSAIPGIGDLSVVEGRSVRGMEDVGEASMEALSVGTREEMRSGQQKQAVSGLNGMKRGRDDEEDNEDRDALGVRERKMPKIE